MSDETSSWFSWILIGGLVAAVFAFTDVRFSIPKHKPMKHKNEVLSQSEKRYFIVYNEDFTGSAIFNSEQRRVDFEISNTSKESQSFENAKCFLWTTDHVVYELEMKNLENKSWDNGSSIFNPRDTVYITVLVPKNVPVIDEILGFSISLKDGLVTHKIRFGYQKLGLWDRLRWWIAEQIRAQPQLSPQGQLVRDRLIKKYGR